MSSFHKTLNSSAVINGTKLKNNLPMISSGVPSLDHVIGGGLPSGSIFVVEEDVLGHYSRVLTKYFLAEGIVCNHALLIASVDENPQDIVTELPSLCVVPVEDEVNSLPESVDKMMIAWRYENLAQVESSFGSNTNFGHHFDLSKHIDVNTVKNSKIIYHNINKNYIDVQKCAFNNILYHNLLLKIKEVICEEEYQGKSINKNILRICIQSIGSPIWMANDCDEDANRRTYGQDLVKFLYCLRVIVRDTNAVAFITIPTHLLEDDHVINRFLYSVDNAVRIESFAGSSRETNPVYKDYHGLFHITKLSAINSIVPYVPPSLDLAFKLKRKKFIIEKLHLPPELQDSSEREQDDITATPNCGGFKKKDIEF